MSAYYNDIDPYCCNVLRKHLRLGSLPGGRVDERDIQDVQVADIIDHHHVHLFAGIGCFALGMRWAGYPETLRTMTLGFPCQDLSSAGKQAGLTGKRSGLWKQAIRLIEESHEAGSSFDFIIIENVRNLLSGGDDDTICTPGTGDMDDDAAEDVFRSWMGTVLADLASCGLNAEWCVLRASDFGAPHIRERVFIVAYPHSTGWASIRDGLSTWQNDTTLSSSASHVAYSDRNGRGRTQRTNARDVVSTAGENTQGEGYPQWVTVQCSGTDVADASSERGRLWQRSNGETWTQVDDRSTPVAHSNGTQWGTLTEGRDVSHRHDTRWQETTGRSRMDGQATMADASEQGLPLRGCPGLTTGGTQARAGMESELERCSELANPDRQSLAVGVGSAATRGSCTTTARSDARPVESGLGRIFVRATSRLDGYRWPAGPGEPQHSWESPRVVTEKVPHRVQRLKALGNAVVPQCVEYVARCILASLESEGIA